MIVDADAHVIECDRTWEFMDGADLQFKPPVVVDSADGGLGVSPNFFLTRWGGERS